MSEEEHDKQLANIKWRTPNPSENIDDIWAESLSAEKRRAFEAEREDLRLRYEVYYGDEMNMDTLTTNGSDDVNSEVLENLVRESIERVSLWLEADPDFKTYQPTSIRLDMTNQLFHRSHPFSRFLLLNGSNIRRFFTDEPEADITADKPILPIFASLREEE
ncbi:hypothetical protein Clacol_004836 [Clathrus columnatus]|uniref:Uncharacterized protein n=1 Tax=Clathrus columnatus TaxID=1419009 RepID=A0AAV5ABL8_9AGAM|nr:hypothetical protein Clacol_004836 [Clathrus columnatus]